MEENKSMIWVERELFRLTQSFKRVVREMEKMKRQIAEEENNGKKRHRLQHRS